MPNITQWAPTGLHTLQAGALMASGAPAGFANLTTDDEGDSANLRLLVGAVSVPSPLPQSTHVRNRGEDGYISDQIFDATPNNSTIGFEAYDGDLGGFLNKETVVTLGEWDLIAEGGAVDFRDVMWLASRRATSKESGSTETGYENLAILKSGGRLEPGDMGWQAIGTINAVMTASPALKDFFGRSVLSTYGKANIYSLRWFSEYPASICAAIGDASMVDIQLGFTPVTAAKCKAFRYDTGAPLTVSSVNTSTDIATLSAAPGHGIPIVVLYESSDL